MANTTCARPGTVTLARNAHLRVFETRAVAARDYERVLRACNRHTGRTVRLARAFDDGYVTSATYSRVRLAGRFVAWSSSYTDVSCKADCPPGYDTTTYAVHVRDIRLAKSRNRAIASRATALVVTARGAIAWTVGTAPQVELSALDSAGRRVLDSGAIDPKSLAAKASVVTWSRDGRPRSETVGGY
jgi:hypothetical protein